MSLALSPTPSLFLLCTMRCVYHALRAAQFCWTTFHCSTPTITFKTPPGQDARAVEVVAGELAARAFMAWDSWCLLVQNRCHTVSTCMVLNVNEHFLKGRGIKLMFCVDIGDLRIIRDTVCRLPPPCTVWAGRTFAAAHACSVWRRSAFTSAATIAHPRALGAHACRSGHTMGSRTGAVGSGGCQSGPCYLPESSLGLCFS